MYRRGKASLLLAVLLAVFSVQLLLSIKIATSQTVDSYYPTDYNLFGATAHVSGALTDLQSDNNVYMTFRSYPTGTDTSDFADNISDVDLSSDKGTHSNFTAQQYGPDLINDTLTETGEYGGVQTVLATGSVPYQMDKDQRGCFGAVFWNPTHNVCQVTRVEFNASSATNEVFNDRDQGAGLSYPLLGWERDAAKKVIYWTGTINVQPHTAQEFYVDIDGNGKDEVFTVAVRITANSTVYSNEYVTKQVNGDVPWSVLWLGQGPTPAFNISVLPSTETTFYVSFEENCNKDAIDIGGTLTILVPSEFTNVEDVGGTGWGSANVTGNKIEVSNNESIQNTYKTYAFDASTPSLPGLYMLNISFSGTPDEHPVGNFSIHVTGSPNCELDLEIQWTNVDYTLANEELCIYGGKMGAENIRVDVWNGSGWENLFTDLNSGWNNVSVSSYLTSSTFTIRFEGGNETSDTTKDSWDIDVALLHVWSDEYTTEVEFTGSSNTEDWSQLNWTVNSAWTIGSVNVTLQLYDYTLGNYSTAGDGCIAYTSSATSHTDETKSQTITTNPTNFRDSSGNWKMKIRGFKSTASQFDFRVDLIKFEATSVATPDVAVLNIIRTPASARPGEIITINVTVKNEGGITETFNVTTYYNDTQIGKQIVSNLASDTNITLTFDWNTTGVPSGTYTIKAIADTVPGETETADNTYIDDTVKIKEIPVASFTYSPEFPISGEAVNFNASLSTPEGGIIVSYEWDFGDDNTTIASTPTIKHSYTNLGNYTVILNVTDSEGLWDTESKSIRICSRPIASFVFSPAHPAPNNIVLFNATDSYDPDGTVVNYTWNFGDGNVTITSSNVTTHVYSESGDRYVTLTVIDNDGYSDYTSQIITVHTHDVAILNVTVSHTDIHIGKVVNITVTAKNEGTTAESFNVTVFRNETVIGTQLVLNLAPDAEKILNFYWNTSDVTDTADFLIQAKTDVVSGESDVADNTYLGDIVKVSKVPPSSFSLDWNWILLIGIPPILFLVIGILWKKRRVSQKFRDFGFFDEITDGGIPDSFSVLITGGPGSGKSVLCQQLTHTFLTRGKSCIHITYDSFPDEVRENMEKLHWEISGYENEGKFVFIDCFSSIAKVTSREKYSVSQPFSLSDLGIMMSKATSEGADAPRVFLDSMVPLLTHVDPSKVVEFLQNRSARIKGINGTFIFTVGKETIEPNLISQLEEVVDCAIELDVSTSQGKTIRKMRIKKMRGRRASDKWVQFEIDRAKGIVFLV